MDRGVTSPEEAASAVSVAEALVAAAPEEAGNRLVITSYSIHYTKLYEPVANSNK